MARTNLQKLLGWVLLVIGILMVVNVSVLSTLMSIGVTIGSLSINLLAVIFIISGVLLLK